MATYLFAWNPNLWDWVTLDADLAHCRQRGYFTDRWSCGVTKKIVPEDRAFLIRLGPVLPRGIMASGTVSTTPYTAPHWDDASKASLYVDIRFDTILDPTAEALLAQERLEQEVPEGHWSPQASGTTIAPNSAASLEELWRHHLHSIGMNPAQIPDEVVAPERYWEGAVRRVSVNAYERDPRAREACLAHHGRRCVVCGFNFGEVYGAIGEGFIHAHHLDQLSDVGANYELDPKASMVPVCPNCHAMLHRQRPPLTPDELREQMKSSKSGRQ